MLKTEDSERVESILEHSEGTLLLFCEEEHFHVVLPFHKDVSPLFKLKPLKYCKLYIFVGHLWRGVFLETVFSAEQWTRGV